MKTTSHGIFVKIKNCNLPRENLNNVDVVVFNANCFHDLFIYLFIFFNTDGSPKELEFEMSLFAVDVFGFVFDNEVNDYTKVAEEHMTPGEIEDFKYNKYYTVINPYYTHRRREYRSRNSKST